VSDAFDRIDAPTAAAEGGWVDDPDDRGGETNHGITIAVAREAGFKGSMKSMTAAEAKAIRRKLYYERPRLDAVAVISEKVAAEVYDTGINMGLTVAGKYLQRALNVLIDAGLPLNGNIGPLTLAALRRYIAKRGLAGEAVLVLALNCLQGVRYIELAEGRPQNRSFIYGWLRNRVSL
jgi:lysozyme family protein